MKRTAVPALLSLLFVSLFSSNIAGAENQAQVEMFSSQGTGACGCRGNAEPAVSPLP